MSFSVYYSTATTNGNAIDQRLVISLKAERRYRRPDAHCSISFLTPTPIAPAAMPTKFTVVIDGKSEEYIVVNATNNGNIVSLFGRSLHYRLLVNTTLEYEHYQFSPIDLTQAYLLPYVNVGYHFPSTTIQLSYFYVEGTPTIWSVLSSYCRRRFVRIPRINAQKQLDVYVLNSTTPIILGTNMVGRAIEANDTKFELSDNTKNIISKIYVNHSIDPENPDYSHIEANPNLSGNALVQELFFDPPGRYLVMRDEYARTMIYESNLSRTRLKIGYPVCYLAHPGDIVKLTDIRFSSGTKYLYVGRSLVEYSSGSGWNTELELWDTKYLVPWAPEELANKGVPLN